MSGIGPDAAAARSVTSDEQKLAETVAELVVERLRLLPSSGRLVDAAALADALGVSRQYVYANAAALGAVRLGAGPRGRLRFDLNAALSLHSCSASKKSNAENANEHRSLESSGESNVTRLPNRLPLDRTEARPGPWSEAA